jgi:ribonucleoside-triphosphate reductase
MNEEAHMEEKVIEKGDLVLEDGTVIPKELRTRCEVWSRPVGYLRPVQHWNNGKREEFKERKKFRVEDAK